MTQETPIWPDPNFVWSRRQEALGVLDHRWTLHQPFTIRFLVDKATKPQLNDILKILKKTYGLGTKLPLPKS